MTIIIDHSRVSSPSIWNNVLGIIDRIRTVHYDRLGRHDHLLEMEPHVFHDFVNSRGDLMFGISSARKAIRKVD